MNGHHLAHYVLEAALAAVVAAVVVLHGGDIKRLAARKPVEVVTPAPAFMGFNGTGPKALKGTWPGLGQDKTIALGEALQKLPVSKAVIFCAGERCRDLMADIDDAFQIADWDDIEEDQFMGATETGFLVGPAGPLTDSVITALRNVGIPAELEPQLANSKGADIAILIGHQPKAK